MDHAGSVWAQPTGTLQSLVILHRAVQASSNATLACLYWPLSCTERQWPHQCIKEDKQSRHSGSPQPSAMISATAVGNLGGAPLRLALMPPLEIVPRYDRGFLSHLSTFSWSWTRLRKSHSRKTRKWLGRAGRWKDWVMQRAQSLMPIVLHVDSSRYYVSDVCSFQISIIFWSARTWARRSM